MFGRMKDPVKGAARLMSCQLTNVSSEFDRVVKARVVVEATALEPNAAGISSRGIPHGELPLMPGTASRCPSSRDADRGCGYCTRRCYC